MRMKWLKCWRICFYINGLNFKGVGNILELIKIESQNGVYKEVFKNTDKNSKIKSVTYIYNGTEKNLDDFLYKTIIDYAKENKIID
jgi:hypothetical protein